MIWTSLLEKAVQTINCLESYHNNGSIKKKSHMQIIHQFHQLCLLISNKSHKLKYPLKKVNLKVTNQTTFLISWVLNLKSRLIILIWLKIHGFMDLICLVILHIALMIAFVYKSQIQNTDYLTNCMMSLNCLNYPFQPLLILQMLKNYKSLFLKSIIKLDIHLHILRQIIKKVKQNTEP